MNNKKVIKEMEATLADLFLLYEEATQEPAHD